MMIETKYCGQIDCKPEDFIVFPNGLFGFEQEQEFILIRLEDDPNSPFCLQSTHDFQLAFILFDPFQLMPDYAPDISDDDCIRLGNPDPDDLVLYAICTLHEPFADSTVNLRCPIVLNVHTRTALQTILPAENGYSFRTRLGDLAKEDSSC